MGSLSTELTEFKFPVSSRPMEMSDDDSDDSDEELIYPGTTTHTQAAEMQDAFSYL
jgi:hypothetical protein